MVNEFLKLFGVGPIQEDFENLMPDINGSIAVGKVMRNEIHASMVKALQECEDRKIDPRIYTTAVLIEMCMLVHGVRGASLELGVITDKLDLKLVEIIRSGIPK